MFAPKVTAIDVQQHEPSKRFKRMQTAEREEGTRSTLIFLRPNGHLVKRK
jgi:hypothetical protein